MGVSGTPAAIASITTVHGPRPDGRADGQAREPSSAIRTSTGSTFTSWFNTAAYRGAGKGDPGNASQDQPCVSGVNNTDSRIAKQFSSEE